MPGFRWMMLMTLASSLVLSGCDSPSGGAGGGEIPGPNVQLSGRVTYDHVPVVADVAGPAARLDYEGTLVSPARGVQVVAVGDDGRELASGTADADGRYILTVPKRTSVRLRAVARLFQAPGQGPSWDFSIRDNTSPGYASDAASIYAVQGAAFDTGGTALTHNLHASSGWDGTRYGGPRSAAPFAILDQIYSAMQKVLAVDEDALFAPMNTYWSIHNRSTNGNKAIGEITTSHWDIIGAQPGLYILGKEDLDTDEYDTGVIVHEWGHYFESKFSRADSVGGNHGGGDILDMRVAFGEAWGNSLAGMVRDDPIYADTQGVRQGDPGVVLDLNTIPALEPRGWFNEASVQHVLYSMYQSPLIGFEPIYEVMIGPQKDTPALTSLFSFATYLRADVDGAGQGVIDTLLNEINTINGSALNIWGIGQGYPSSLPAGFDAFVIPVYEKLPPGSTVNVCGTNQFGTDHNKLGNFQFLHVTINDTQAGDYDLTLKPQTAPAAAEDVAWLGLYSRGTLLAQVELGTSAVSGTTPPVALMPGDYTVAVIDTRLTQCQDITLTKK